MPAITPVTLDDYRDLVQTKVKDIPAHLVVNEVDSALLEAVKEHSRFRVLARSADYVGTGNRYIALNTANFPGWADGFSRITDVDSSPPVLTGGVPADTDPSPLEIAKDVQYMKFGTSNYLFFPWLSPDVGQIWRFTYTVLHTIDGLDNGTVTTVYPVDAERFANLAAHYVCISLSSFYRQSAEMEHFNADVVNYGQKSDQYLSAARNFRALYNVEMGNSDEPPANIHADYDAAYQWDRPFLTHRFRGSR